MRALAITAVFALSTPALAATPRDSLVVSPAWLEKHLTDRNLVVLQVGDRAGYEAGHIPNSRLISAADLAAPMGGEALVLELPDPEALRAKLVALGVTNRSKIVVAPTREGTIQSATRVVFTLDAAGLGDRTRLLEGGTAAWVADGRSVTKDAPKITPGKLAAIRYRPLIVDADFVKRHARAPGYRIVDSRAPEFYSGARAGGSAAKPHKSGHIAGAASVPFMTVTTADLKLASADEIASRFKAAGVRRGDTVITYCHVGQQASATLFAARSLGLKVKLYDGSFEEWSRLNGEVETGEAR